MHSSLILNSTPQKYPVEGSHSLYERNRLRQLIRTNNPEQIIRSSSVTNSPMLDRYNQFDELGSAHKSLTIMKKDFNSIRFLITSKQEMIAKMRQEIDSLIMQEQKIQIEVSNNLESLREYNSSYGIINTKYDEEFLNNRTYNHMIDRLKHDNLLNKNKTIQMRHDSQLLSEIVEKELQEYYSQKQFTNQSNIVLNQLIQTTDNNAVQREKELQMFQNSVYKKQEQELRRDELRRVQEQMTEKAKEFQNSNEKKLRKLYLVHKFLNIFLKQKMELLMKNYQPLEYAFQKIKAQTGVTDTTEITRKFLNREKTYGFVLISISEYEKQLQQLMTQNYELKKNFNGIKDELINLENNYQNEVDYQQMKAYHRKLEDFMFRYKRGKVLKDKLYRWILKMLVVISKIDGNYNTVNIYDKYPESSMKEAFFDLKAKILPMIQEVQIMKQQETSQILQNLNRSMLEETQDSNELFQRRNVRISADSRLIDYENESLFLNMEDDSYAKQQSLLKSVEEQQISENESKDGEADDQDELTFMEGLREKQKINDQKEKQRILLQKLKEQEEFGQF